MTLTPEQFELLNSSVTEKPKKPFSLSVKQLKALEPVEESEPSVLTDIARVGLDVGENIAFAPINIANLISEATTGKKLVPESFMGTAREEAVNVMSTPMRLLGFEDTADKFKSALLTDDNQVRETETVTGAVAEVVPYIAGGVGVAGMKALQGLSTLKKGVIGGAAINQALADTDSENMFNAAEELLPQNLQNDFVSFMASKEDDTQLEQRLKLVGEELTLGVLGELVGSSIKVAYRASKYFGKQVGELTKTEKGELLVGYLKDARDATTQKLKETGDVFRSDKDADYFQKAEETVDFKKPEGSIVYEEAPEGSRQVAKQQGDGFSNLLGRMTGQFFSSRGYWSKKAFNAFEDSQYAQRQAIATAEHTANRLQKHLDAIVETNEGPQILKTVEDLFKDNKLDFTFAKGLSFEDKVKDVSNQFNLPKNISTELVKARDQIDALSKGLTHSSAVPDDLKEAIVEGAGSYLRRSYRLYEDSGYVPSDSVTAGAEDFLIKQFQKVDPDLSDAFALKKAKTYLTDLVSDADKKSVGDYMQRVKKINTGILEGRKDVPKELRAYMGEIKEPGENIILTVSKMTHLLENNKFFGTLKDLGESGGYIREDADGIYKTKIAGTNSDLDGRYTTESMAKAIYDKQGQIGTLRQNKTYNKGLKIQSKLQKYKTVYNHITHMKNLTGGAVMAAANGVNPFSKESVQTFKTLRNAVVQGGDTSLDESYEKYLRLGIINTNVQVNEYRELLETGYRAGKADGFDWVAEKMPYGGSINKGIQRGQKVLKGIEDVYVATDDFYKINTFLSELDTLKKAKTGKSLDVLEAEAARITQNTYANYDRVPYGIKALKDLPIGSFVAFPAESIRVSVNILKQGAQEITSGNPALVARGMQRLSAFTVTQTGVGSAALATGKMVFGEDEEKIKAANELSEAPWSKVAPRMWFTGEEGKLLYFDTASNDPFTAVKAPATIIANAIMSDNLKGEELTERLVNVVGEASWSVIKPFVGATVASQLTEDVIYAAFDSDGRTRKGKEIFTPGLDPLEKLSNASFHIIQSALPGGLTAAGDLIDVVGQKPNPRTGKPKDLTLELLKNLTGVSIQELDPAVALGYAVTDYNKQARSVISSRPDYEKKIGELESRYDKRQKTNYKLSQELYRQVNNSVSLVGEAKTFTALRDSGVSETKAKELLTGVFNAEKPSKNKIVDMYLKTPHKVENELHEGIERMIRNYASMTNVPLIVPSEATKGQLEKLERMKKSVGGEVTEPVSNAPKEPDERINKLTGLPYNEGAGPAYMDIEDPLRALNMAAGGRVKKNTGGKVLNALKRNCN